MQTQPEDTLILARLDETKKRLSHIKLGAMPSKKPVEILKARP